MRLKNKYAQFYFKNYDLVHYELKEAGLKGKNQHRKISLNIYFNLCLI